MAKLVSNPHYHIPHINHIHHIKAGGRIKTNWCGLPPGITFYAELESRRSSCVFDLRRFFKRIEATIGCELSHLHLHILGGTAFTEKTLAGE